MPAGRLHNLGIISRVAAPDELEAVTKKLVDRLSMNAPISMRTMKAIMLRQMDVQFHAEHSALDDRALGTYSTRDAVEGVAARLEKRIPTFEGR